MLPGRREIRYRSRRYVISGEIGIRAIGIYRGSSADKADGGAPARHMCLACTNIIILF